MPTNKGNLVLPTLYIGREKSEAIHLFLIMTWLTLTLRTDLVSTTHHPLSLCPVLQVYWIVSDFPLYLTTESFPYEILKYLNTFFPIFNQCSRLLLLTWEAAWFGEESGEPGIRRSNPATVGPVSVPLGPLPA